MPKTKAQKLAPGRYKALCVKEPAGKHGLIAYLEGKVYDCEFRKIGMVDKSFYFRLWYMPDQPNMPTYQTCSESVFHEHFNIVG